MRPPTYKGKRIVIEIDPCSYWGESVASCKAWERQIRKDVDTAVRAALRVGPYSKTVRTRLEKP